MANPDYATLLSQIAAASGGAKTALEAQCYVFDEALTDTEKNLFNYVSDGYFLLVFCNQCLSHKIFKFFTVVVIIAKHNASLETLIVT